MPVRLTDIPGLRSTQLNMPGVDPKVAAAPAMALGDVAEGIASISTAFSKIGHSLQRQADTTGELEVKQKGDADSKALAEQNRNDPNAANHIPRARKANAELDKAANSPHLSPAARAKAQTYAAEQKDANLIAAGGSAASQQVQQKKAALEARMKGAFETGNEAVFRDTLRIGQESGDYDAETTLRLRQGFRERVTDMVVRNEIKADPRGWIERNKNPDREDPGFNGVRHSNWMSDAHQWLNHKTEEVYNKGVRDIKSGDLTLPSEVDTRTTGLDDSVGIKLKDVLREQEQRGQNKQRQSKEEQDRLVGEVSAKIRAYDASGEHQDKGLVEILDGLRKIDDDVMRETLQGDLNGVRTGKRERAKTNADRYTREIDTEWDNYGFGRQRTPVMKADVAPLLKDGLLKDPVKLRLTGMSEADIAYVTEKDQPSPQLYGGRIPLTDEQRVSRFREKYNAMKDRKPVGDAFLQSAFDSIAAGKTEVEYSDPEEVKRVDENNRESERAYGRAKVEFAEWKETNAGASAEQIEQAYRRITTRHARDTASYLPLPKDEVVGSDLLLDHVVGSGQSVPAVAMPPQPAAQPGKADVVSASPLEEVAGSGKSVTHLPTPLDEIAGSGKSVPDSEMAAGSDKSAAVSASPMEEIAGSGKSVPDSMMAAQAGGGDSYKRALTQIAETHGASLEADERQMLDEQMKRLSGGGAQGEAEQRQSMNTVSQLMDRVAVKTGKDVLPAGKNRKQVMKEGLPGSFMIAENPKVRGDMPKIELPGFGNHKLKAYEVSIRKHAEASGVDPLLIQAILYMEESHGYYDAALDVVGKNKSIRPMNINVDFWGSTFGSRKDMKDPDKNIQAGAAMLGMIHSRLPKGHNDVASIATLYNNINATKVSEYGARVARVYEEFKKQQQQGKQ